MGNLKLGVFYIHNIVLSDVVLIVYCNTYAYTQQVCSILSVQAGVFMSRHMEFYITGL